MQPDIDVIKKQVDDITNYYHGSTGNWMASMALRLRLEEILAEYYDMPELSDCIEIDL